MPVRFFGPVNHGTGYGNAVINFAKAFSQSKIKTKFVIDTSEQGKNLMKTLNNFDGKTNIDFYLHCPPFSKHHSNAYKIGYFYWEADQLPRQWIHSINKVNELWVPCKLVRDACLRAKFRGPIKIIPTPCDDWIPEYKTEIPHQEIDNMVLNYDIYKFYSIFQWQNRKGFKVLLNSYYKTFTEYDKVILILKVNPLGLINSGVTQIRNDIIDIKKKLGLKFYPPVYLSTDIISKDLLNGLHLAGDCYVSSHHGEGWGMPIHDAMRFGKQIIVTKYGGVTEALDDNSAHIIKHTIGPVANMEWSNLYDNYQNWAYPSQNHLSNLFMDVYQNHKKYEFKGINAKEIADKMTIPCISRMIEDELGNRA